ncbi:MAG: sugar ABC transporter permease [Acidimicrobiales bacterium]
MPPSHRNPGSALAGTPDPPAASSPDITVADDPADAGPALSGELVVDSFWEYAVAAARRVRGGDAGVLPVLVGLLIIVVIFQSQSTVFLSAGNLVNLVVQGATFVLLGMAEVFVLLLAEIDLSTGYVAGVGAVITVELSRAPYSLPWWVAIGAGLVATAAIGALQGFLITRIKLPSFVVTLAGLLGWEGVLIFLVNKFGNSNGGTISITNNVINDLVNGNIAPVAAWVILAVCVVAYAAVAVVRDRRRRASGLAAPVAAVTALKIALVLAAGIALVLVCNTDRGTALVSVRGVPWVVLIIIAVLVIFTFLLGRTRFGRYIYAIGGNAEAARRAGINLSRIRLICFSLTGLTSGLAGILYASRLGSISNNVDGGTLVLYAIAAAVIGGTSLFGGRGKMVHALLGGIVIATIYNGLGLLGIGAAAQDMVTALVLLAAVTVDAVARRNTSTA